MATKPIENIHIGDVIIDRAGATYTVIDVMDWPGERWLFLDSGDVVPVEDGKAVMIAAAAENPAQTGEGWRR